MEAIQAGQSQNYEISDPTISKNQHLFARPMHVVSIFQKLGSKMEGKELNGNMLVTIHPRKRKLQFLEIKLTFFAENP